MIFTMSESPRLPLELDCEADGMSSKKKSIFGVLTFVAAKHKPVTKPNETQSSDLPLSITEN